MTAAVECAATYPAALTAEEDALVAQLKAKYSGSSSTPAAESATTVPAAPAPPASTPAAAPQVPPVHLCIACGGSGTVAECYDCRSIQRTCPSCGGTGTASGGSQTMLSNAATPRQQAHKLGAAGVAAQVAAYERELAEMRESLGACTDKRERELREELARQLQRHLARLRQRHQGPC